MSKQGGATWTAEGILDGRLVFVAISTNTTGDANGFVTSGITTSRGGTIKFAQLRRPDGTIEQLPASTFIYQLIDGQWSETAVPITLGEWKRFLESKPEEYSIYSLSKFLGRSMDSR